MSINPLNDISKVYLEQVAYVDESAIGNRARSAVADDRLSAEQERTNASMDKLRAQDSRHKKSTSLARAQARIAAKKSEDTARAMHPKPGVSGYRIEETGIDEAKKEKPKRWWDDDDDGIGYEKGEVSGKFKRKKVKEGFSNWRQDLSEVMDDDVDNKPIKEKKVNNKIKTSALSGGLKLGEAIEEIGGTLLEMVEIDEVDFVVESVYDELLEEGYEEDDIEEAIEFALTEAKVTFGHDTPTGQKKRGNLVAAVGRLARQKLSSKVRGAKKAAGAAVVRGARKVAKGALGVARKIEGGDKTPSTAHTKSKTSSTYRGAGVGQREKVSSGSYTPPTKKKAEKPADPWKGSATTPQKPKPKPKAEKPADPWEGSATTPAKPKAKTKKATAPKAKAPAAAAPKRKRKSKLDSLLADIRSEQFQIDEKITAKTDMGAAIKDFYSSKSPQLAGRTKEQRRKAAIAAVLTARRGGRKLGEQMDDETSNPSLDKNKQTLDKTKFANLKMLQQKKQQLERQKLQMQKSGKLPLEAD